MAHAGGMELKPVNCVCRLVGMIACLLYGVLAPPAPAMAERLVMSDEQNNEQKKASKEVGVRVTRIGDGPIIHPGLHPSIGENIQGPSLLRVPDWIDGALGQYYLYFADHKGAYIRLAYADALAGPWKIHVPGSLQIEESHFLTEPPFLSDEDAEKIRKRILADGWTIPHDPILEITAPHIASPDVHVDEENRQIVMYFHGLEGLARQVTRVATSDNGIDFKTQEQILGRTYWRAFRWSGYTYALAMPGQFYRSKDPFKDFEEGPLLFNPDMRHNAVLVRDDTLHIFWTQVGDAPEHIKHSTIDLKEEWMSWVANGGEELLRPECTYEGMDAPLEPSVRSTAYGVVNQLRDPAIYVEGRETYLLYAVGGEAGIGLARVNFE